MSHGDRPAALQGSGQDPRARMIQREKLATLGGLTAGIAHEINNPIGFVKNNALMLDEYLQSLLPVLRTAMTLAAEPGCPETLRTAVASAGAGQSLAVVLDDIEPLLHDTLDGIRKLETIAAGLRRFARRDLAEGEDVDLNQCLRDALGVARNRLEYQARIIQHLTTIPTFRGRPGDIRHIALDLLLAAARTLPAFGEIQVRTDYVDGDIRLVVTSNGPERQPGELERLLASPPGNQSPGADDWSGLAVSHEIAADHGGRIEVVNAPAAGVAFSLFIPLAPQVTEDHIG